MGNNRNRPRDRPVTLAEIAAAIATLPSILPPNYVEQQQLKRHLKRCLQAPHASEKLSQ